MNDSNKLTKEDLQFFKELIKELDNNNQVFRLSKSIVEIKEKKLIKELNQMEGENKK